MPIRNFGTGETPTRIRVGRDEARMRGGWGRMFGLAAAEHEALSVSQYINTSSSRIIVYRMQMEHSEGRR
jgi:hypothetical protein